MYVFTNEDIFSRLMHLMGLKNFNSLRLSCANILRPDDFFWRPQDYDFFNHYSKNAYNMAKLSIFSISSMLWLGQIYKSTHKKLAEWQIVHEIINVDHLRWINVRFWTWTCFQGEWFTWIKIFRAVWDFWWKHFENVWIFPGAVGLCSF